MFNGDGRERIHRLQRMARAVLLDVVRDTRLRALALAATGILHLSVVMVALSVLGPDEVRAGGIGDCASGPCPAAHGAWGAGASATGTPAGFGDDEHAVARDLRADVDDGRAGASPESGDASEEGDEGAGTGGSRTTVQTVRQWGAPRVAPPDIDDVVRSPQDMITSDLASRRLPYDSFESHAEGILGLLPSLDVLHHHFPDTAMTRDIDAQRAYISELAASVEATVEGFDAFDVDVSRRGVFTDLPKYHERIRPRMFVVHWTGMGYRDVDHFVKSLRPYRVQFFMNTQAEVYDLFDADDHKPAHARGANDFAQGVEIETGPFDGSRSPLFSYTPEQIEQTVYLAVEFLRRNDLPVDETTLMGHYTADLIFSNPYYNPYRGTFSRDRVRKFDPPQELMEVIVDKARQLDQALAQRGDEQNGDALPAQPGPADGTETGARGDEGDASEVEPGASGMAPGRVRDPARRAGR